MAESDDKARREYERRIREDEKKIQEQAEERKRIIRDTFKPPKPQPDDEDD